MLELVYFGKSDDRPDSKVVSKTSGTPVTKLEFTKSASCNLISDEDYH